MKSPSSRDRQFFQKQLISWFKQASRDLPWRQTRDPYAILVSEMMLQQTQVDRVIPKYHAFLKRFPTAADLATAKQADVVALWQGLGYNRRALYLQKACQVVTHELGGKFPQTIEGLQKLPGIGPYTAGAIASFAFELKTPLVDTNVERVIGRIFLGFRELPETTQKEFWDLMTALLPRKDRIWIFNQAIMEFGALVCTASQPKCDSCPMQKICTSFPEIQTAPKELLKYKTVVKEKQYFGQPRRIWRGKILKFLHTTPNGATLNQIGKAIQPDFDSTRLPWLKTVITALEKDGFIKITTQRIFLA
jgi:A/G-specific adenine glycosylase